MLDAEILAAAIASREAYDRVSPHITGKDLTPDVGFWYDLVGAWYERDRNASSVDVNAIRALGESRISNPKQRESILVAIGNLPVAVSASNVAHTALEIKRHNTGLELAAAIAKGDTKRTQRLHVLYGDLLKATELGSKKRPEWQLATSIDELFSKVGNANRIPIAPNVLNQRINGGALPGHHIVVYARPEMGKSTFAINFAVQLAIRGHRVLYVGNEDQIDILKSRSVSRATQLTAAEIEQDLAKAIKLYRDRGVEDRLIFGQLRDGNPDTIRKLVDEYEPQILVIDQIRNLAGGGDGLVANLEANGQAVRRILLEYGLIGLSVSQAGVSADFKLWLDMGDLDSSKTGLPGTADLLIGIGATQEMLDRNQRALALPKNKLSSAANAHEGIIVEIDKSRSLYK